MPAAAVSAASGPGLDGLGTQSPLHSSTTKGKNGIRTHAQRARSPAPKTGKKGSRRSVSIVPPHAAGRGTDCPRRGVRKQQSCSGNDRHPHGRRPASGAAPLGTPQRCAQADE
jgi:hypothetical protein